MTDDFPQYCGRTPISMEIECERPELERRIADLEAALDAKWISVSERLPREIENGYRWVRVYDAIWKTQYDATWNGEEWSPLEDREKGTITHWQPLPAPPDEKENHDQTKR